MPKDCDLSKEDKLKSGRCVKKCPDDSIRHEITERCRKNKSKSASQTPALKKTVKRCPNGYRRNKAGDCIPTVKIVQAPIKQLSSPSSSETTTVPMKRTPSSSETTTVPMKRTPSSSETTTVPMPSSPPSVKKKTDSWGVDDIWDNSNVGVYVPPTKRRKRAIIYDKPYNSATVITRMKKKKRSPLGKLKVYERFNKLNKAKFANASHTGKLNLLQEYQVNPRNTESGSYAVPGIDPEMYAYYNMLADKHKKLILEYPKEKRMDFLNYIYALDTNTVMK